MGSSTDLSGLLSFGLATGGILIPAAPVDISLDVTESWVKVTQKISALGSTLFDGFFIQSNSINGEIITGTLYIDQVQVSSTTAKVASVIYDNSLRSPFEALFDTNYSLNFTTDCHTTDECIEYLPQKTALLSFGCTQCIDTSQVAAIEFWARSGSSTGADIAVTFSLIKDSSTEVLQNITVSSIKNWRLIQIDLSSFSVGLYDGISFFQADTAPKAAATTIIIDDIHLLV